MAKCEFPGCHANGEAHHGLRNRRPFNRAKPGSNSGQQWRNYPDVVESLCPDHHRHLLHELYPATGGWPDGYGFHDSPLLRKSPEVQRMLTLRAENKTCGKPSPEMLERRLAGGLANVVLYNLCSEYPDHSDIGAVQAKIGLIGRYYSASPKRGVGNSVDGDNRDFDLRLARHLVNSELDEKLKPVREISRLTRADFKNVTEAHSYMERSVLAFINRGWLGGNSKKKFINRTSFCSKYLHFHAPKAFFIYDSVVLGRFNLRDKTSYSDYLHTLFDYAEDGADANWTPRSIDMEIYGYGEVGAD